MSKSRTIYFNTRIKPGTMEIVAQDLGENAATAMVTIHGIRRRLSLLRTPSFCDYKFTVNPYDFGYTTHQSYPDMVNGIIRYLKEDYPHE